MKGTKAEPRNNTQEAAISCQTMLELMGLPSEAKKKLALMLMGGELDSDDQEAEEQDQIHRLVGQVVDPILELSLAIKRMRAVAQCFGQEYIDTSVGITSAMMVHMNEEHFESLFNAFFGMIVDIDKEAEKLQQDADQIFHDTLAKV